MIFEYKQLNLYIPIEQESLDRLGKDGWEMVGCIVRQYMLTLERTHAVEYIYYFKRLKYGKSKSYIDRKK